MTMNDRDGVDLTRNPSAEREVIGTVIAAPAYAQQAMQLRAEDFTVPTNQVAWRAIAHLLDRADRITVQSVCAVCGNGIDMDGRREIERMASVAGGTSGVLSTAVAAVLDAARRRAAALAFTQARQRAISSDDPIDVIAARTAAQIDDAVSGRQPTFMDGRAVVRKLRDRLSAPVQFVPTGLPKFDHVLGGGLEPANVVALIARTKIGKTTMAATISHNLLHRETPEPHLVVSLERGETDFELLCAARALGMPHQRLRREFKRHEEAYDAYGKEPFHAVRHYEHNPGATLEEIRQAILTAHRLGAKGFILDHIQLIEKPSKEPFREHMNRCAQTLANLASRLGMWGVVNAQSDVEGLPKDCDGLWLAASGTYVIRRDPDAYDTWLQCLGSYNTEGLNAGQQGAPAMMLCPDAGPYFKPC